MPLQTASPSDNLKTPSLYDRFPFEKKKSGVQQRAQVPPARHATPRHATPHHATPRHATQRNATQRNATQRNATQRNTTPHHTTPHHIDTPTTPPHQLWRSVLPKIELLVANYKEMYLNLVPIDAWNT